MGCTNCCYTTKLFTYHFSSLGAAQGTWDAQDSALYSLLSGLKMGMWDSTDQAAAAAGPGSVPLCFRAAPVTQLPQMDGAVRPKWGITANFLGFLQSASAPSCSFLIVVSRTGEVLLQKLQLLVLYVIHLLIIYENIITEQLSKQSPPSSTPSPPNKPM